MSLWNLLGVIFAAGAVGGVANALLTENGFILPRWAELAGARVFRPGFLLNMFVGGLAGSVSWGLYGPMAGAFLVGGAQGPALQPGITVGALAGAVLVGVAGARWLTNEAEKRGLRAEVSARAVSGLLERNRCGTP